MIQNGCIVSQGCAPVNSRSGNHVLPSTSVYRCASRMSAKVAASKIRSFSRHNVECKSSFPRGTWHALVIYPLARSLFCWLM